MLRMDRVVVSALTEMPPQADQGAVAETIRREADPQDWGGKGQHGVEKLPERAGAPQVCARTQAPVVEAQRRHVARGFH